MSKAYAKDHNLTVGSPITVISPDRRCARPDAQGHLRAADRWLTVRQRHDLELGLRSTLAAAAQSLHVREDGGRRHRGEHGRTHESLKTFPNAKAQTRKEFTDNQIAGLQAGAELLYVLLALSIVVSVFGIVNTLVLTVYERTREIGMLRAIGLTRRQTRRMIRNESVITALIGAALGIVLGLVLGGLLAARVKEIVFAIPWTQLVIFAIASIVVGIIAAIFPARRAAQLDPLEALHTNREVRGFSLSDTVCLPKPGTTSVQAVGGRLGLRLVRAPRDTVPLGRLGDRPRHCGRHLPVEDARDHVLGADLVGSDHRRDRVAGGDLHPLGDRRRAHVEGAAEDAGEGEHVVDLVRVVGAARRDDGDASRPAAARARSRASGSPSRTRSRCLPSRSTPAPVTAPGAESPMKTSAPSSASSASPCVPSGSSAPRTPLIRGALSARCRWRRRGRSRPPAARRRARRIRLLATPAAPAPVITTLHVLEPLADDRSALSSAASTTIAVPC